MTASGSSDSTTDVRNHVDGTYVVFPVRYLKDQEWVSLRERASARAYARAHLVWWTVMMESGKSAYSPITLGSVGQEVNMPLNTVRDAIARLRRHGLLIVHARGAPYPVTVEIPIAKRFKLQKPARGRSS